MQKRIGSYIFGRYGRMLGIGLLATAFFITSSSSAVVPDTIQLIDKRTNGTYPNSGWYGGDNPVTSADGRFVAFQSSMYDLDLDKPISRNSESVYIRDRLNGTTKMVSVNNSGTPANNRSYSPAISADGRYITYMSMATNLSSSTSTNGSFHIYRYDTKTSTTDLVDVSSASTFENNASASTGGISADGRYVAFMSPARNLDANYQITEPSTYYYIYVKDMQAGTAKLVSKTKFGNPANGSSYSPSIDCSGSKVAFVSNATGIPQTFVNNDYHVFVVNLLDGSTKTIAPGANGTDVLNAKISCSGSYVAYTSKASNLSTDTTETGNTTGNVYLYDGINNTTALVNRSDAGAAANAGTIQDVPYVSSDGKYVTFSSNATNLVANDTNAKYDSFVRNMQTKVMTRLSVSASGTEANNDSVAPSISADGRYVVFRTIASNLVVQSGVAYGKGVIAAAQTGQSYEY